MFHWMLRGILEFSLDTARSSFSYWIRE